VGDILKGVLAFFICGMLFPEESLLAGIYAGAGAILGHDFPFYLKFKGGKGIAATIGMVLSLTFVYSPLLGAIPIAIGIWGVAGSRFISVGSIVFSISIPICACFLGMPAEGVFILTGLACLAVWLHRANIKRLRTGTENKFTLHKSVQ